MTAINFFIVDAQKTGRNVDQRWCLLSNIEKWINGKNRKR